MNELSEKVNMINDKSNPFITGNINGRPFGHTSASERIDAIKSFDGRQCVDAIQNVPGLQKTVLKALRIRLEKIQAARLVEGAV